jgi:hypothetical protein
MFLKRERQPQPQPPGVNGIGKIWQVCYSSSITMLNLKRVIDKRRKKRELKRIYKQACSKKLAKQRYAEYQSSMPTAD